MSRFYSTIATLAALVIAGPLAAAQVSEYPPPAKTESITVAKAIALRNALVAATGLHDKIVGQGASQAAARVMYEIDSTARWALNDDINALTSMLGGVDKTLNEMRAQMITNNGGVPLPDKAEDQSVAQKKLLQKFNDDFQALMNTSRDVAVLFHVRRGDFKEPLPGEIIAPMQQAGIIDP